MLSVCNECPYPRDNDQYLDGILQLGRKTLHRPQPESRPDNPEKRKATRCHRRSQNRPEGANLIEIPCDLHISERPEWGSLFLCRTTKVRHSLPPKDYEYIKRLNGRLLSSTALFALCFSESGWVGTDTGIHKRRQRDR